MTGKIIAKADRQVDIYQHVDHCRQEIFDHGEEFEKLWKRIHGIENQARERRDWTETGIWKAVKLKLDDEAIDWVKWLIRAALAGLGTLFLSFIVWGLRLAMKGFVSA